MFAYRRRMSGNGQERDDAADAPKEGLRDKRKRQLKAELSRQGMQLFAQKGFEETTIDDIVGPLAVSKRTFFRYFATKEDLVVAWYEELTGELVSALEGRPKSEPPNCRIRGASSGPVNS